MTFEALVEERRSYTGVALRHGDIALADGWAAGRIGRDRKPQDGPISNVPSLTVSFLLQPRFTLLAFAGFVEALRHTATYDREFHGTCRWTIMGPDTQPVMASCGVKVTPWQRFDTAPDIDYLIVVGGLLSDVISVNPETKRFLKEAVKSGIRVIGLCTGSFVLAEAGLLEGRRCCIHWNHHIEFLSRYPDHHVVSDELFVVDNGVITCAGGGGSIDLATWLIQQHFGKKRAYKTLRHMLVESARSPQHPQPHFYADRVRTKDPRVRRAVHLMEVHIDDPISVADLAGRVSLSRRQLERAFQTSFGVGPAEFSRHMRLDYAHWMICNTGYPITEIAFACGFSDGAHLSRTYRNQFGTTPRIARARKAEISE